MPPRTTVAPQVPGEPPVVLATEENPESTQLDAVVAAIDAAPAADSPSNANVVMVDKADLAALIAEVRDLREKVDAAPVIAKRANPEAGLPDADSVDVSVLRSPILTKQGWLVPENFGANPAVKKAL